MILLNECFLNKLTSTFKNRLRYYDTTESEPSKVWYKGIIRYNYNVWIPHAKPSLRTQVLFLGTRMRAVQLSGGKPDEYGLPQWSHPVFFWLACSLSLPFNFCCFTRIFHRIPFPSISSHPAGPTDSRWVKMAMWFCVCAVQIQTLIVLALPFIS